MWGTVRRQGRPESCKPGCTYSSYTYEELPDPLRTGRSLYKGY